MTSPQRVRASELTEEGISLVTLPLEVFETIFCLITDPGNLAMTCREFYLLSKTTRMRALWILCQVGTGRAFEYALRLQKTLFSDAETLKLIFNRVDAEAARRHYALHRQRLIRMSHLPGFSVDQFIDSRSAVRSRLFFDHTNKGKNRIYPNGSTLSDGKLNDALNSIPPSPPGVPRFLIHIAIKRYTNSNQPQLLMAALEYGVQKYKDVRINKNELDFYRKNVASSRYQHSWAQQVGLQNANQGATLDNEITSFILPSVLNLTNLQALFAVTSQLGVPANSTFGGGVGNTNSSTPHPAGQDYKFDGKTINPVAILNDVVASLSPPEDFNGLMESDVATEKFLAFLDELDQDLINLKVACNGEDIVGHAMAMNLPNHVFPTDSSPMIFLASLPIRLRVLLVLLDGYRLGLNYCRFHSEPDWTPHVLAPEGYKMMLNMISNDNYILLAGMLRRGGQLKYQVPWAVAAKVIRGDGKLESRQFIDQMVARDWSESRRNAQDAPDDFHHPSLPHSFGMDVDDEVEPQFFQLDEEVVPKTPTNLAILLGDVPEGFPRSKTPKRQAGHPNIFSTTEFSDYPHLPESLLAHALSTKKVMSLWVVLAAMHDWKTPEELIAVPKELIPRDLESRQTREEELIRAYQRCVDDDWMLGRTVLEKWLGSDVVNGIRRSPEALSRTLRQACRRGQLTEVRCLLRDGAKLAVEPTLPIEPCQHSYYIAPSCPSCDQKVVLFVTSLEGQNSREVVLHLLETYPFTDQEMGDIVQRVIERHPPTFVDHLLRSGNVKKHIEDRHLKTAIQRRLKGVFKFVMNTLTQKGLREGRTFRGYGVLLKYCNRQVASQETTLAQLNLLSQLGDEGVPSIGNMSQRAERALESEKFFATALKNYQVKVESAKFVVKQKRLKNHVVKKAEDRAKAKAKEQAMDVTPVDSEDDF
jgi:hypothetical protein